MRTNEKQKQVEFPTDLPKISPDNHYHFIEEIIGTHELETLHLKTLKAALKAIGFKGSCLSKDEAVACLRALDAGDFAKVKRIKTASKVAFKKRQVCNVKTLKHREASKTFYHFTGKESCRFR